MQEELEVSWYWRSTQAHAPSRASSGGGERGQRRGAQPVVWVSFEVRGRYSHMQVAAGVLGIGTSVGDWRIRAGASRRLSDVINNNSLAVLVCEGWSWAPRDREGECRGGRRTKGPREIRGGASGRQGPSDATLQGSAWANSSPRPVEEGRWSDQTRSANAHVQGFEKHWRSPGPMPAHPSPGLHTKHAALLGTEDPKFSTSPRARGNNWHRRRRLRAICASDSSPRKERPD